jgi:hypothetical protein
MVLTLQNTDALHDCKACIANGFVRLSEKSLIGCLIYMHTTSMPAQIEYGLWLREFQKSYFSYMARAPRRT